MDCQLCGKESVLSGSMPFCPDCIRTRFDELRGEIAKRHADTRRPYDLPAVVPKSSTGIRCTLCVNSCRIDDGMRGYCGVRLSVDGRIAGPGEEWAYVQWYHDPLPTNCVADWICEGHTHSGFTNLAVFYEACTFNCLFCQNWHYRDTKTKAETSELVRAVDPTTGCICFFGGDPSPFCLHTIAIAREIARKKRRVRICWETNGSVAPRIMEQWVELAMASNGCIKIDFKTFSEELNLALCGVSNKNTIENIGRVAIRARKRRTPPLLVVSTLLIPGYIDEEELVSMARFISSVDRAIHWSFLGFYPHFHFDDLPRTSNSFAETAVSIAREYGITNTRIGNVHLLI
jgi:pyruvate formate lyase activating enzyme